MLRVVASVRTLWASRAVRHTIISAKPREGDAQHLDERVGEVPMHWIHNVVRTRG
jgi:hypothetical protein